VDMVEQLGASTLVHGILEGTDTALVASLPGIETVESGTVLGFSVAGEALHLFDPKTDKRI